MKNKRSLIILLISVLLVCGCWNSVDKLADDAFAIKDYRRAITLYDKALWSKPRNVSLRYKLIAAITQSMSAESVQKITVHKSVARLYEECALVAPFVMPFKERDAVTTALYKLAHDFQVNDSLAYAVKIAKAIIALDAESFQARNLLGFVYAQQGRFDEAEQMYTGLLNDNNGFISAYINLGNLQWSQNRVEDAYITWSLGIEVAPQNEYLKEWVVNAEEELLLLKLENIF